MTKCECGCGKGVQFKGHYRKKCQPAGTPRDPTGKVKRSNAKHNPKNNAKWHPITNPITNAKWNPVWNPITSAIRKKERHANAEAWMIENGNDKVLTDVVRDDIVLTIAKSPITFNGFDDERLHNKSLEELFKDPDFCCYIGMTKRSLGEEALRWLSERGADTATTSQNRPVLRWKIDGAVIKESEAKDVLKFNSVWIYQTDKGANASYVEDRLQMRYDGLGLPRRLHRQCGMGDNGFTESLKNKDDGPELHKVFVTYSFDVKAAIASGLVEVVV